MASSLDLSQMNDQTPCRPGSASAQTPFHARKPHRGVVIGLTTSPGRAGALLLVNVLCLCGATSLTGAQEGVTARPETSEVAAAPSPEPPMPGTTMQAYRVVDGWVREWNVPAIAPAEDEVPSVGAACVTLRLHGEVIGRGVNVSDDHATLWRAAMQAFREANRRLPVERDALYEQRTRDEAARVTISLELAGALVPFTTDGLEEQVLELSPGVWGVAARLEDRINARFPEAILSRGAGSINAIAALVAELSDDPNAAFTTLDELRAAGFQFYRFRTSHVAQPRAGAGARFLYRGGRVIGLDEITTSSMRSSADGLATNLMQQRWPGIERFGMMGTLDPVAGRFDPQIATPFQQAISSLALLRYADLGGAERVSSMEARRHAQEILQSLSVVEPGEIEPWATAAGSAACLIALAELPAELIDSEPELQLLRDRCRAGLEATFEDGAFAAGVRPNERGLVAMAWVRSDNAFGSEPDAKRGEAAVRAVFRETPPDRLVGQMPFLGWAELELAGDGPYVPAAAALRDMRSMMWERQLTRRGTGHGLRDLVGGVVFAQGPTPLPNAHVLRPLAFAASMLGDPRLTTGGLAGEAGSELTHLVEAQRFVRQLAGDDTNGYMYRRPDRALWGIRHSPWEQQMDPAMTALALLGVTETLRSMRVLMQGIEGTPEATP